MIGQLIIGQRVLINTLPACPLEFQAHGILPYTKGLAGVIKAVVEEPALMDHLYRVSLTNGHHGYFANYELEPY